MTTRNVRVDYMTRVEGEGALELRLRDGRVEVAQLRIFEPPRLFEAFLRGRGYAELPDLVARICGICPIAYQMSAVHAVENAFGVHVDGPLRALRRLVYCGEWIESHALHVAMLHAPDFVGVPDAVALARDHGDMVRRALHLKKTGNALIRLLGGRAIHPVNVRPGGLWRAPAPEELQTLVPELRIALDDARELAQWVAGFEFPDVQRDYEFVALRHPGEYPFNEGRLVSSQGLDLDIAEFEQEFEERHLPHSTALHAVLRRRGAYLTGPLARWALNFDRLDPEVQDLAARLDVAGPVRNPFRSIIVRCLEMVHACAEALRIVEAYRMPEHAALEVTPRRATGFGCTEAPRGFCWHRYDFDDDGTVKLARIVPPTSQNQPSIEADLVHIASGLADRDDQVLREACERAVRNHDPCISCATHFLQVRVLRE